MSLRASVGDSLRQGAHQVAQRSTSTTLPFCSTRENVPLPSTVFKTRAGAGMGSSLTPGTWLQAPAINATAATNPLVAALMIYESTFRLRT
jgi:hypothetical protein